jgi:DNA-binding IclR family transcriptional regulator
MTTNKTILSRAIRVIDAVSKSRDGLSFSEASKVLDAPSPSTVNKILKELVQEGILQKSMEKRYTLGRKVYFWGRVMAAQNTPVQVIRQRMKHLHEWLQISVNLFTCVDKTMFCLESYLDPNAGYLYPVGKSLPLNLNVQGAVFFMPAEKLDDHDFLEKEALKTEEPLSVADLTKVVEYARLNEIMDDFCLFYPGTRRFAVPIQENGRTVMTLGVGMSATRAQKDDHAEKIIAELKDIRLTVEDAME